MNPDLVTLALTLPCPSCGAESGEPCTIGGDITVLHQGRIDPLTEAFSLGYLAADHFHTAVGYLS